MELNSLLEIIVLIAIIVELYSLTRHAKLEQKLDEHIKLLDEHMKRLDEHITRLDRHLDSSHQLYIQNLGSTNKEQET